RVQERGLLAADVGAGAAVQRELELVARAGDALAEPAALVGLLDRLLQDEVLPHHLAADVDVGVMTVDREAGDDRPLDELVRVPVEELAVLAGAGLGLVGVDDEIDGLRVLGDEAPLHAGEEAGSAAAAQVRLLDLVEDLARLHAEGLLDRGVAAAFLE